MPTLPDNKHDLALWFVHSLNEVTWDDGHVAGNVPQEVNLEALQAALDAHSLSHVPFEGGPRRVGCIAHTAMVYRDFGTFIGGARLRARVPAKFSIVELGYTHGVGQAAPEAIGTYLQCMDLYEALASVADLVADDRTRLVFVEGPTARVDVRMSFEQEELQLLPQLNAFVTTFVATDHHKAQKRSLIRSSLIELFKNAGTVTLGDVIGKFDSLVERVKAGYELYMAEFSFEKVKAEVDKDNLDTTVRLNKTLSDIQNQLLAIPVALVLSATQMSAESGLTIKNGGVWAGSLVFTGLVYVLVRNQQHAVEALKTETDLRWEKLKSRSEQTAQRFLQAFDKLRERADRQIRVLWWLFGTVAAAFVFSTLHLAWNSLPSMRTSWEGKAVVNEVGETSRAQDVPKEIEAKHEAKPNTKPAQETAAPNVGVMTKQPETPPTPATHQVPERR